MSDSQLRPPGFTGTFRVDQEARDVYAEAAGIAREIPLAVALPANPEDLCTLIEWAASEDIALIPRGSGSGMAGGAVGGGRGVIVDLSGWRRIHSLDPDALTLRCDPGVTRQRADEAAREHDLRFPVEPSSGRFCSVGGMSATNAAGARSLRYGSMRKWVHALDCVLADGSICTVSRGAAPPRELIGLAKALESIAATRLPRHEGVRKESSGYAIAAAAESGDIADILIGSEGTLAFFTAVELRLAPRAGATASALAAFANLDDAVQASLAVSALGATACELLDRTFLEIVSSTGPLHLPANTEAVLMIELEGESAAECQSLAVQARTASRKAGATLVQLAVDPATENALWTLRHAASPILARLDPRLKSMQFIEDACVPPTNLSAYVRGVRAALDSSGVRGVIFGHAGDANVHVNPLIDVSKPDWRRQVETLLQEITALTASLGGTLTGEHGDGRLRTPLLDRVWSAAALADFEKIKRAVDPEGVLNPGVKRALAGQRAIENVKYDPQLPGLAGGARAALDFIERDRAYDQSRLELLDLYR